MKNLIRKILREEIEEKETEEFDISSDNPNFFNKNQFMSKSVIDGDLDNMTEKHPDIKGYVNCTSALGLEKKFKELLIEKFFNTINLSDKKDTIYLKLLKSFNDTLNNPLIVEGITDLIKDTWNKVPASTKGKINLAWLYTSKSKIKSNIKQSLFIYLSNIQMFLLDYGFKGDGVSINSKTQYWLDRLYEAYSKLDDQLWEFNEILNPLIIDKIYDSIDNL